MSREEYQKKYQKMEQLLTLFTAQGKLNASDQKELDMISEEIATYEEKYFPFEVQSLSEMIELRMYQRKLKQKDLAAILGTTPSRISEILNGKRGLTLELAKGLYQKLNIDPKLILSN